MMQRRALLRRSAALAGMAGMAGIGARAEDFDDPDRMYEALVAMPKLRLTPKGGAIDLVFSPEVPAAQRPAIIDWVQLSAAALVQYFGQFPVEHLGLLVTSGPGRRVGHGTSYGYAGPAIRVNVGRETDRDAFLADWVLVHEMVHLSFPTLPRRHLWIEEGSATYVEPVARVQAGHLSAASVWQQWRRGLPQGLPQAGDEGLDNTHTWGRTYWGGALFCLLADVAILRRTNRQRGLQDALRAIRAASGGNAARWSIDRALRVGDEAVGSPVLSDQYRDMRQQAVSPDLGALFAQLGVRSAADAFDESAPLADIRRAIMAPRAA